MKWNPYNLDGVFQSLPMVLRTLAADMEFVRDFRRPGYTMNASVSVDQSVGVSGSVGAATDCASVEVGGAVGINMSAEGHIQADKHGLDAGAAYNDVAYAEATASATVGRDGIGGVSGSATAYVKTGTELEAHVIAGDHGVDVGGGASIGDAAGVDAELSRSDRYTTTTVGAGVSVGEHFAAGGGAAATYNHGVVAVGVSGDLAAFVGLDVDVGVSVNTNQIVKDGKKVAHAAETVAPVVATTATNAANTVAHTATNTANTITNGEKSATNSVKKAFKKIKL